MIKGSNPPHYKKMPKEGKGLSHTNDKWKQNSDDSLSATNMIEP